MLITNFASGELSENMKGRIDLQQYYQGASRISNFEIIPTGGIYRRTGLKRMSKLHGSCRLIPFILDKDNSFILELCTDAMYIWKNGFPLIGTDNQQVKFDHDNNYSYNNLNRIKEIQYAQDFNKIILVSKYYSPIELTYSLSQHTFTLERAVAGTYNFYPEVKLDDDYDYIIEAEDGLPEYTEGKPYCIYQGKLWKYNIDEEEWQIQGHESGSKEAQEEAERLNLFTTDGNYPGCVAYFNSRLYFASTENGRQKIWASKTPSTNSTRYKDFSTYVKYVTVEKVIKDPDLHVFTANIVKGETQTTLTNLSQDLTQLITKQATDYFCINSDYFDTGARVASITQSQIVINAKLKDEEIEKLTRIVFTISLWKQETATADDYEFKVVQNNMTTSDCSFYFELASDQNDAIKWLASSQHLAVGTESNVWNIPSGINALSIAVQMSGRWGSDEIQAHPIGNAIVFFSQGLKGIREYYYNSTEESFVSNNIAILAEQMLTESKAVDFDFMTNPYSRLIVTREDGTIAQMLYDKTNGIMAWSRIETYGKIKSVAVVRGDQESDIIYMSVQIINEDEEEEYYLEKLDPSQNVYLDSYSEVLKENIVDIENYDTEKAFVFDKENNIFLPYSEILEEEDLSDTVIIGYKYRSEIESLPVLPGNNATGQKRITALLPRFCNSYFPTMKVMNGTEEYFDEEEEPYSGIKNITYPGQSERDVTFSLVTDKPNPVKILNVEAKVI